MLECKCSVLYQLTNFDTHSEAFSMCENGFDGKIGAFSVLNKDSENGLSLLTEGLENDGMTPSFCIVTSIVEPLIGLPLSE